MLRVHSSNRFETLADLLVRRLAGPREDVFATEPVAVPSTAVRRALTLALADHEGVCANTEFAYLARWLWQQVARVLPSTAAESPFDADSLGWRIHTALGDPDFVQPHPRLARYLDAAGADAVMRFELAGRIGALFEQYVTYRPDWLAAWQQGRTILQPQHDPGRDEAWQAALWRRIAAEVGAVADHPLQTMARSLADPASAVAQRLPSRVHVFGLSTIPPLHLAALQALSGVMDVELYVLNPCSEFWFDLKRRDSQVAPDGHRLLASWGGQTQSALAMLDEISHGELAQSHEQFRAAGNGTLLARLQDSFLELREPQPGEWQPAGTDRSLEVHVCHSLTRELEVLHDHLLGLFAQDPTLRASDVLVVTPDLETAAPLIEAVFGTVPGERHVPFALTGRSRSSVNAPVRAFLGLLALASSRCAASEVHATLQQPVVARRFGLDADDLQSVHEWMLASGTHWALDERHVAALSLPGTSACTAADGLERLFLGYALPDAVHEPFDGYLPAGAAEGSSATALGGYWRFVHALRELRATLERPRAADSWTALLHRTVDAFVAAGSDELEDLLELHRAIDTLGDTMARAAVAEALPFAVLRAALERTLDDPARGGVATGRVTFAGMASLRNLPFRVVCAIGLDRRAFPGGDRPFEFDLMAQAPRLGDRQRRLDQRTLFLDLLLAARSSVYLSYAGRSLLDNAPLPPSVLVSELLDVLVPATAQGSDEAALQAARRRLVVEHPLQPFSPEVFAQDADPRLRSFDAELAQALRQSLQQPDPASSELAQQASATPPDGEVDEDEDDERTEPARPFFAAPLPAAAGDWRELPLPRLVEFFRNPSRFLLRHRLRLDLPADEETLADEEPFVADFDARRALASRLLPALLAGADARAVRTLATAGTELPRGAVGERDLDDELSALARFVDTVRPFAALPVLPAAETRLDIARSTGPTTTLIAGWTDLREAGLVRWRYGRENAYDVIDGWLHHLVLCASPVAGAACETRWITGEGTRVFMPMDRADAQARLADLLALFDHGLAQPLPFFPGASWILGSGGSEYEAQKKWRGGFGRTGERDRPAYRLAFRGHGDAMPGGFAQVAEALFGGMPSEVVPHAGSQVSA